MASVSITGTGGMVVAGLEVTEAMATLSNGGLTAGFQTTVMSTENPAFGGSPPELRGLQWGIMRFDLKPRSEDEA